MTDKFTAEEVLRVFGLELDDVAAVRKHAESLARTLDKLEPLS